MVSGPEELRRYHREIRTPDDAEQPQYRPGNLLREWQSARKRNQLQARKQSAPVLEWKERGPFNVAGRVRGIVVDPSDATRRTWLAGSASGGAWKTTDAGQNWTLITESMPNLATTVIALNPTDPSEIYLGTGEGYGNLDAVSGSGIFRSTDAGATWNWLESTAGFLEINRIIIDPSDPSVLVVAANSGIHRSTDRGQTWDLTLDRYAIQDLNATPGNFQVQYASENGYGVYKSVNGGQTWSASSIGLSPSGRVEIDISPVNTQVLYASTEGDLTGSGSDLYRSDDSGLSWYLLKAEYNEAALNFLGGQGWYDNAIMADPFQADVVYTGGVNLFRITAGTGFSTINSRTLLQDGTGFLQLVNFTGSTNGNYTLGSFAGNSSIEVRFGAGRSQKAHRFLVPEGATSGVPAANYGYQDFVQVPFEVWDVTRNKQLTVSFRDQDRNAAFNLLPENTTGTAAQQSREYVYVHDVDYNASNPDLQIAVNGGQEYRQMVFFWPVLAPGSVWPTDVTDSRLAFQVTQVSLRAATVNVVSDAYGQFNGRNRFNTVGTDMHPDHHDLLAIPTGTGTFQILASNDGGIFLSASSASPGTTSGEWSMRGRSMRITQFYGADKRPGSDQFMGGTQDNGTWVSPAGISASTQTGYQHVIGGDGFYVIWNQADGNKLIGGSQNNGFQRSTNGGLNWAPATSGLSGTYPFISKLADSEQNPDRIFAVSSDGVFRSTNFGQNWSRTAISEAWGSGSSLSVVTSRTDDNIVWAGSGMSNEGTTRKLHVSENAGISFTPVNNYTGVVMGSISGLATHPTEKNTAFALFSFAGKPKVLRTTDLGQTWTDISGFADGAPSSRGFPDVAVFSLVVHKNNPQVIWVGTELGLVESSDGGQSWSLREDFPAVLIWDMKERENVIVLATHGRGIWTAALDRYEQAIQFSIAASPTLDLGTVNLTATSTSGLPVTFNSSDTDRVSITGNTLTLISPGSVTITATQPGNNLYKPAESISRTVCVAPAKPAITSSGTPGKDLKLATDIQPPLVWLKNGTEITGAVSPELTVEESGVYAVRYTRNGCTAQSANLPVVITSAPAAKDKGLRTWPNPTMDVLHYETGWTMGTGMKLVAYDMDGRTVLTADLGSDKGKLDVGHLPSGIYVLTLMDRDGRRQSTRFIRK